MPNSEFEAVIMDDEAYSFEESKHSSSNDRGTDDTLSLENNEAFRQAEMQVLALFIEKRQTEIASINAKYSLEMQQLEKKP